ncbi:MAG TPA: tetratricopeptide repeat protein [Verrucomicrobiae bacterium]|nr:tetratricopeptide repeat protein [Verrucomicrobiae bacterium]
MKARILLVCVLLTAPGFTFAASKEIQELQRDIALLQQQVKDLQRSQDEKFASLTELARQAIEAANRANTGVAVIQSNLDKSLRDQESKVVAPVVGLGSQIRDISNNVNTLAQAVSDLTSTLNRMQAQMTDLSQQVKTMQAPPPAPPNATGTGAGQSASTDGPCGPASSLYDNALRDYRSGKYDLAVPEFNDYLRCYGNTDLAPNAQFYVAMYHYGQKNFDDAVREFDMVLEKYPDNNKTPEALLYKGRALAQTPGHKTEGANEWRELIKRFPKTDPARMACDDLKSLGYNCAPPAVPAGKKSAAPRKK